MLSLLLLAGKYDSPDRLFHAVDQCFASVLINPADIKESIPQFYDPKAGVDLLLNLRGLQLGVTQTGTIIDDVKLPAWAKSPKDFLKKNRKALESEFCTKYLPSWIDLIFGAKARGEPAFEANNLFHPTSYLSPKDLEAMETEIEKMQAELQATEFGICPDVLFSAPHPQKSGGPVSNDSFIAPDSGRALLRDERQDSQWERVSSPLTIKTSSSSKDKTQNYPVTPTNSVGFGGSSLASLGPHSKMLKYAKKNTHITPTKIDSSLQTFTSDDADMPKTGASDDGSIAVLEVNASDFTNESCSESESNMNICINMSGTGESLRNDDGNSGTGTFGEEKDVQMPTLRRKIPTSSPVPNATAHSEEGWGLKPVTAKHMHGAAVSGCHLSLGSNSYVTTTSLDGSLMVHTLPNAQPKESKRRSFSSAPPLVGRLSHHKPSESNVQTNVQKFHMFRSHHSSDPLACLSFVSDRSGGHVAFAGGHDDVVFAYGINSACGIASVYSHRDAVTGLVLIEHPTSDQPGTHIMVSGSWDATVKLFSVTVLEGETVKIGREPFAEFYDSESSVDCVDAIYIPNLGIAIAAGGTDGSLTVWLWSTEGGK